MAPFSTKPLSHTFVTLIAVTAACTVPSTAFTCTPMVLEEQTAGLDWQNQCSSHFKAGMGCSDTSVTESRLTEVERSRRHRQHGGEDGVPRKGTYGWIRKLRQAVGESSPE